MGPPEKNPYTGKLFRPSVDYLFQEGAGARPFLFFGLCFTLFFVLFYFEIIGR